MVVRGGEGPARAGGADVALGTNNSMDATADSVRGFRPAGRLAVMGFEHKPLTASPAGFPLKRTKTVGG